MPISNVRLGFVRFFLFVFLGLTFLACAPRIGVRRQPTLEYPVGRADLESWSLTSEREFGNLKPKLDPLQAQTSKEEGEVVLTFVHVSDVQVRDFSLVYHNRSLSRLVDRVVKGTERRKEIDTVEEYPFLVLTKMINDAVASKGREEIEEKREISPDSPAFLIHTGDAIEAGTVGEFLRFASIANRLSIPWFNVIGNHDILTFGNFSQHGTRVDGFVPGLELVGDRAAFMNLHKGIGTAHTFTGLYGLHPASHEGNQLVPGSDYHGFDCDSSTIGGDPKNPRCTNSLRPYYSFSTRTNPPLRIVVLDTNLDDSQILSAWSLQMPGQGAGGFLREDQASWLRDQITQAKNRGEAVLVFGHHPLSWKRSKKADADPTTLDNPPPILQVGDRSAFSRQYLLNVLEDYDNVLGYFGGHTHKVGLFAHLLGITDDQALLDLYKDGSLRPRFFAEVIAPSLHEFPQVALLVRVLRKEDNLLLSVKPIDLAVNDTTGEQKLRQACIGARRESGKEPVGGCNKAADKERVYELEALLTREVPLRPPMVTINEVTPARTCVGADVAVGMTLEGTPPFHLEWANGYVQSLESHQLTPVEGKPSTWKVTRYEKVAERMRFQIVGFSDRNISGTIGNGGPMTVEATDSLPGYVFESGCEGDRLVYRASEGESHKWYQESGPGQTSAEEPKALGSRLEILPDEDGYGHWSVQNDNCHRVPFSPEGKKRPRVTQVTGPEQAACPSDPVEIKVSLNGVPGFIVDVSDGLGGLERKKADERTLSFTFRPERTTTYRVSALSDSQCQAKEGDMAKEWTVKVLSRPQITKQPEIRSLPGEGDALSVQVDAAESLEFAWYRGPKGNVEESTRVGVGKDLPMTDEPAGTYWVLVQNGNCQPVSSEAFEYAPTSTEAPVEGGGPVP